MSNSTEANVHHQVKIFVTMLCEGFNVPNSETKMQAFGEKLKNPHVPALRETYNIFTDGRGSTTKMPTIAEVMDVYKGVVKRLTTQSEQKLVSDFPKEVDYQKSKEMFKKLTKQVHSGNKQIPSLIEKEHTGFQDGYKFTLTRDKMGRDTVFYHNHPNNLR